MWNKVLQKILKVSLPIQMIMMMNKHKKYQEKIDLLFDIY